MDNKGLSSHIQVSCSCTHWDRINLTTRPTHISIPTSTQESEDGQGFQTVLKCIPYQNIRILLEKIIYRNPGHVTGEFSLSVRLELPDLGDPPMCIYRVHKSLPLLQDRVHTS